MSSNASDTGSLEPESQTFDESPAAQGSLNGSPKSALWRSLYVLATSPSAVNENTVTSVPTANNPRPLRGMGDSAEYWVNDSGELFTFKFPATIDFEGQFDRTGPYFNLPRTGLDLMALKKMRAQFEVQPLDCNATHVYPAEAIKCSATAIDMLNVLHGEAEDARNALLPSKAVYPRDVPFWRCFGEGENERFSVVLTTDPLIQNIPDPSRSSVPRLKRSDIGKGDSMQSPSKAKAAALAAGAPGGGGDGSSSTANGTSPAENSLSRLPDPLGRYAGLMAQNDLRNAIVVSPMIRDGEGVLIKPQEYRTKLTTGDVVMVECLLKLWSIGPPRRENASQEERLGSRRYQVMLKSMQLLPDASITLRTAHTPRSDKKGKRKASDDDEDDLPRKKVVMGYDSEEDDDDGEKGDDIGDVHAMQVTDD